MSQGQRNVLLGSLAVAILGVAIVLFARGGGGAPAVPKEYQYLGVCLACKEESSVKRALDDYPPFTCPRCGKQALYPWFFCESCKKRFVPDLVRLDPNGPLRVPSWPACPCRNCRSNIVGQYVPEFVGKPPAGDAPLPEWRE